MGVYEMLDRMCGITTMLADLVREQASIIAQADIPDETKEVLAKRGMPHIKSWILWNTAYGK